MTDLSTSHCFDSGILPLVAHTWADLVDALVGVCYRIKVCIFGAETGAAAADPRAPCSCLGGRATTDLSSVTTLDVRLSSGLREGRSALIPNRVDNLLCQLTNCGVTLSKHRRISLGLKGAYTLIKGQSISSIHETTLADVLLQSGIACAGSTTEDSVKAMVLDLKSKIANEKSILSKAKSMLDESMALLDDDVYALDLALPCPDGRILYFAELVYRIIETRSDHLDVLSILADKLSNELSEVAMRGVFTSHQWVAYFWGNLRAAIIAVVLAVQCCICGFSRLVELCQGVQSRVSSMLGLQKTQQFKHSNGRIAEYLEEQKIHLADRIHMIEYYEQRPDSKARFEASIARFDTGIARHNALLVERLEARCELAAKRVEVDYSLQSMPGTRVALFGG